MPESSPMYLDLPRWRRYQSPAEQFRIKIRRVNRGSPVLDGPGAGRTVGGQSWLRAVSGGTIVSAAMRRAARCARERAARAFKGRAVVVTQISGKGHYRWADAISSGDVRCFAAVPVAGGPSRLSRP
jgi:hypothetical protein